VQKYGLAMKFLDQVRNEFWKKHDAIQTEGAYIG
jgi:hypothetical protein